MKRIIPFALLVYFIFINTMPAYCIFKKGYISQDNLREIQSKTYYNFEPAIVEKAILNLLSKDEYKILLIDQNLDYITASTNEKVRNTNYFIAAYYTGRLFFDTAATIATYGLRGYALINDVALLKMELKDKDLEKKVAISISSQGNTSTIVRINMTDITTGKRNIFIFGPKRILKTTNITKEEVYDAFFSKLDRELQLPEYQKIQTKSL